MDGQIELSVVIPAYLEEENLRLLLPRLRAVLEGLGVTQEILVIDTAKPMDNTAAVCAANGAVHLPRTGGNAYGDAVRTGIARAAGRFILFMDADGSHSPEYIPSLWMHAAENDIVAASRYVPGGATENPRLLIAMSRVLNVMYRTLLRINCLDVSNSYKLYRADLLKGIRLDCRNFDIIEEILIKCSLKRRGLRIREIPFSFKKRMFGQTKRSLLRFMLSFYWTLVKLLLLKAAGGRG
jgi:dolichol-phosphate mannosyltransferase